MQFFVTHSVPFALLKAIKQRVSSKSKRMKNTSKHHLNLLFGFQFFFQETKIQLELWSVFYIWCSAFTGFCLKWGLIILELLCWFLLLRCSSVNCSMFFLWHFLWLTFVFAWCGFQKCSRNNKVICNCEGIKDAIGLNQDA